MQLSAPTLQSLNSWRTHRWRELNNDRFWEVSAITTVRSPTTSSILSLMQAGTNLPLIQIGRFAQDHRNIHFLLQDFEQGRGYQDHFSQIVIQWWEGAGVGSCQEEQTWCQIQSHLWGGSCYFGWTSDFCRNWVFGLLTQVQNWKTQKRTWKNCLSKRMIPINISTILINYQNFGTCFLIVSEFGCKMSKYLFLDFWFIDSIAGWIKFV